MPERIYVASQRLGEASALQSLLCCGKVPTEGEEEEGDTKACHAACTTCQETQKSFPPLLRRVSPLQCVTTPSIVTTSRYSPRGQSKPPPPDSVLRSAMECIPTTRPKRARTRSPTVRHLPLLRRRPRPLRANRPAPNWPTGTQKAGSGTTAVLKLTSRRSSPRFNVDDTRV